MTRKDLIDIGMPERLVNIIIQCCGWQAANLEYAIYGIEKQYGIKVKSNTSTVKIDGCDWRFIASISGEKDNRIRISINPPKELREKLTIDSSDVIYITFPPIRKK